MSYEAKTSQDPYTGYHKLLKTIYLNGWKFRRHPDLFEQVQETVAQLITNETNLPFIVSEVDNALEQGLDARYRFVIQHVYGLNPDLGTPKSYRQIGEIAPRADGGIGLHRTVVHRMNVVGIARLFRYQKQHPIAGLSFNP